MSRWKAGLIHLTLSAIIGLCVLAVILGIWYPPPYFGVSGAGDLALLVIGVDLVLGPLLTTIVFDTRKKSLRFDLSVIALLQAAALIYGVYVMFQSRPVFLVAERGRVTTVYANEVDTTPAENAHFTSLPLGRPVMVGLQVPDDPESRSRMFDLLLSGKGELRHRLSAYIPYTLVQQDVLSGAHPIESIAEQLTAHDVDVGAATHYIPVYCRRGQLILLLDAAGAPLKAVTP